MEKEDARYQKLAVLHERRKQAVRLHRKGIKVMQVVTMTGLSYPTVAFAIACFEAGGWAALKPHGRGRALGSARRLEAGQELHIQKLIIEKRPEQLKIEFALWTRAAVMQLIESECDMKLPVRTKAKLRQATVDHMNQIKADPQGVMNYFKDRYVAYAQS